MVKTVTLHASVRVQKVVVAAEVVVSAEVAAVANLEVSHIFIIQFRLCSALLM